MKKNLVKRLLASALSVAMMCTLLAGCGDSTDSSSTTSTTSSEESSATAEDADSESTEVVELDLYLDFTWYATDSWTGIIPEELTANGGVTFNVTRAADSSQLGLMIASGELPDVIFTSDEIDRLCDSDLCWGYNELIEEYGLDWEPSSDRIAIAQSRNVDADDENYYTILQNYSTNEEWEEGFENGVIPQFPGIYYRKDIWEALGSPSMETIDDFLAVLEMVQEEYPEMTPLNGGNNTWRFRPMQIWYGLTEDYTFNDAGEVIYRDSSENFYDYAKLVNEMYQEEYFPLENLALTVEDDAKQQAISGNSFAYEWSARPTNIDDLNTASEPYVEDAEWGLFIFVDENEPLVRTHSGWAGVFISKNCSDPEAAIKMIEYMSSEEGQRLSMWGREGIDYELDENGIPVFSDEWNEANQSTDTMVATYNNKYFLCVSELTEYYTYFSGQSQERLDEMSNNMPDVTNYPAIAMAEPSSTSDEGIIKSKIDEARDAELVKIYTAETDEEFEAAYASYMALLEQIGVDELNEYINENYISITEEYGF